AASSLSSGEYLPGSLQGKISSDGCLKKRTNGSVRYCQYTSTFHHAFRLTPHSQLNFATL
ncbi:hypothetical protein, partial [Escherichia coli]|uniref:hypothetical protein n=1 Tax=Escherichia coli TaxID=562 RepID=UPI0024B83F46